MKYSDIPQDEKIDFIYDALKKEEKRRWYRMYYRICMFILLFILPYYILLMYGPMLLSRAMPSITGSSQFQDMFHSIVKNISPEIIEGLKNNTLSQEQNGTTY